MVSDKRVGLRRGQAKPEVLFSSEEVLLNDHIVVKSGHVLDVNTVRKIGLIIRAINEGRISRNDLRVKDIITKYKLEKFI